MGSFIRGRLKRVPRVREVWSSNLRPAKSYTALQTVRHRRLNIYAKELCCLGAEMGTRKLVTRFGVIRRV